MTLIHCAFCLLIASFAIPFAVATINAYHGLEEFSFVQLLQHGLIILIVSFPIINIIAAFEVYFHETNIFSYVSGICSSIFISTYFADINLNSKL
jgi:hypothetical protein